MRARFVASERCRLLAGGLCALASALWAQDPYSGASAHWKFDEGTGTKTYDSVNNYLIDLSQANWVPGVRNSCLSFNGSPSYATAWDRELVSTGFTFTAWVKPADASASMVVLSKYATADNSRSYVWRTGSYDVFFGVSSDGTSAAGKLTELSTSNNRISTNWNFIAATYDGTTLRLYVNGSTPDATVAHAGGVFTNGTAQIHIGRQATTYFNGLIDEVAIWPYALTDTEIKAVRDDAPTRKPEGIYADAEAHWEFDEGGGTWIYDYVHGWNGELKNIAVNDWVPGVRKQCLSLNGTNAYVNLFDRELVSTAFTFTAWVKPDDPNAYQLVLSKYVTSGDNRSYNWAVSGNDAYIALSSDGTSAADKLTQPATASNKLSTKWNFIAATYDGTSIRLYVNGSTPDATLAHAGGVFTGGTAAIEIGRQASTYFNGLIDEVAVWTRALSDAEIQAVMDALPSPGSIIAIR